MKEKFKGFIIGLCFLLSLLLLFLSATALGVYDITITAPTASLAPTIPTVVIDAGHGGEDGGAMGATGVVEKDINLAVARMLRDLLEANGIPTIMTRSTDILLYDRNADYKGHKKSMDLATRRTIADSTQNCILVSIHMNAYPATQYSGLQVWYAPAHPDSQTLAQNAQEMALSLLPNNHRRIKAADSNIYLLHHASYPAILVECGFLSNPQEEKNLSSTSYQQALAFTIFGALCRHIEA